MATVTFKIPTLVDDKVAEEVRTVVQRIKGVKQVDPSPATHNLVVTYADGDEGTTLTAIEVALQLAKHPRASFAAGQRRRGFV